MILAEFINDMFKDSPEETNARGNMIKRSFLRLDRLQIDWAEDRVPNGWKQFDTDQDASYFGVWVNPETFQTLTYAEGDLTLVTCPDKEHYNAEIRDAIEFYEEGFEFKTVSTEGDITIYSQDRQEFFVK